MAGFLFRAWVAFSPLATLVGVCGLLCIVLALAGAAIVPARLKAFLIALGALLIAGAGLWQAVEARGAHEAFAATAKAALAAEAARASAAEAITRELAEQSTRDLAAAQADVLKLKDLNNALAQDPRLSGVCLDRGWARRLRAL